MELPGPILMFGGAGMLAGAFRRLTTARSIPMSALECSKCDIAQPDDIERALDAHRPAVMINCAAYTDVDGAERKSVLANTVNGQAVGNLARAAERHRVRLVHFSTDFVFDGKGTRPYRPEVEPAPLGAYGRSKLLGEQALAEVNPSGWLLVRTSWLFGIGGKSFPAAIVAAARAGKRLRVVNDQVGRPTLADDLAAATLELLARGATGIDHVANAGQTNWHNFAAAILEAFEMKAELTAISSADWQAEHPEAARRPRYSVLDTSATETLLPAPLRPWPAALADYRKQVAAAG